jgi:signal transduction histidine kinase
MNLLDNALDAVDVGGNVGVVATRRGEIILVKIIDDGHGIPPEVQKRIYEPFFTTKGVGKGTGLGLEIAKRLLQRSEGGLDFQSVPGRTVFEVRLRTEK